MARPMRCAAARSGDRTSPPDAPEARERILASLHDPSRPMVVSRSFQDASGVRWCVQQWVAGRTGEAPTPCLVYTGRGRGTLMLREFPRDWMTLSDIELDAARHRAA